MLRAVPVLCPRCSSSIELQVSDQNTILNTPVASIVVNQHPLKTICPTCGATSVPAINGIGGLSVGPSLYEPEAEEPRIVRPGAIALPRV